MSLLFIVVPIVALILLALTVISSRRATGSSNSTNTGVQAEKSWRHYAGNGTIITGLVIVSIVAAVVGSGQSVISCIVYFLVGLSALQLHHERFRRAEIVLLLTVLSAATLVALGATLKPLPPFLPISLFICYSVLFTLRILVSILNQSRHKPQDIRSNACLPLSANTTVQGNCSEVAARTPISIHITTTAASTSTLHLGGSTNSIPVLLPSPVSSNSFFVEDEKDKKNPSHSTREARDLEYQPRNRRSSRTLRRRRRQIQACKTSRNVLVCTLVSQTIILAAYICDIISSIRHTPPPTSTTRNLTLLDVLHTACTVASTSVIMSALFLKTYKTHLSFSSDSSLGSEPPLSPTTSSSSYHSESEDAQHIHNHGPSASHRQSGQVVEPNSRAPIIIQLAPPPPPKAKKSPTSDVHDRRRQHPITPVDLEMNTMRLNRAEMELQMIGGDTDVYEDAEVLSISGVMLDKGRPRPSHLEKPLPLVVGDAHAYASSETPHFSRAPTVYVPPPPKPLRQSSLPYQQQGVWRGSDMCLPNDAPSKARKIFGFGSGIDDREIERSTAGFGKRHTIGGAFSKLRKAKKSGDATSFGGPLPPLPPMYVNPPPPPPPAFVAPATAPIPIPIPSTGMRRPSYPDYDDYPVTGVYGEDIGGSADSGYGGMGYGSNAFRYQGVAASSSPQYTTSSFPNSSHSNSGDSTTTSANESPRTPGGTRMVPHPKRSFGSKGRTLSPGLMFELANEVYNEEGDNASARMTVEESEDGQFEDAAEDFESDHNLHTQRRGLELEEFGVPMERVYEDERRSTATQKAVGASMARQGGVSRVLTNNAPIHHSNSNGPVSPSASTFTARPTHHRHRSTGANTMATVPLSPISLDIAGFPIEDASVDVKSPAGTCSTITAKQFPQSSISALTPLPHSMSIPMSASSASLAESVDDEWRPHPFAADTSSSNNLRRTKSGAMSERSGTTLSSISIGSSIGSSGADYSMPVPHLPPALRDSGVVVGQFGGVKDNGERSEHGDSDDEVLTLEETMEGSAEAGRWEDESERVRVLEGQGAGEGESRCVTPRPDESGATSVQTPTPSPTPDKVKLRLKEKKKQKEREKKEKKGEERKVVERKVVERKVVERKESIVLPVKERAIDLHLKQMEVEERMRIEEEEAKIRMRRGVHEKQQMQYRDPAQSMSSSSTNWAARSSMVTSSECASIAPSAHSAASNAYNFPMFFPHAYASGALDEKVNRRPHTPTLAAFSSPPAAWRSGNQPPVPTSSLRFSAAMTMGSVKNAFAGVGAKVTGAMGRNSGRVGSNLSHHSTTYERDVDGASAYGYGNYAPSRNSSARTAHSSMFGSMVIEGTDDEGDFMDLRDPFACPVGNVTVGGIVRVASVIRESGEGFVTVVDSAPGLSGKGGEGLKEGTSVAATTTTTRPARRMSAWGKLPMPMPLPVPPALPTSTSTGSASSSSTSAVVGVKAAGASSPRTVGRRPTMTEKSRVRKQRQRAKKVASVRGSSAALAASIADACAVKAGLPASQMSLASSSSYSSLSSSALNGMGVVKLGAEDADFDFEEALLAQRLLRRLDSHGWDSRSELGS